MFEWTRIEINKLADSADFNRNTTEKVLRLYSILRYFDECGLGQCLALKGGTAINLFLLDLPRLSVDIDLDFTMSLQRNDMLEQRKRIDAIIKPYMADEGYTLNEKSKFVHSLDSYVYTYTTLSGARDVLKIEINYSDRVHILETKKSASTQKLKESVSFRRLADEELIGSKINALLVRTTPRDIFDVYNLFVNGRIINEILIRKIAIFYVCLGSEIPLDFNSILYRAIQKIKGLTYQRVKETLIPVLHKKHTLNITEMSEYVFKKVQNLFYLDKNDETFIVEFNNKKFSPDVLFDGFNVNDVSNHPMGLWKTKQATN